METGNYRPGDAAELREIVAAASVAGVALEPRAGGSKKLIGLPDRQRAVLDLSAFSGVVDYEPSELVLSVRPATSLHEVETLLDAHGQMLAFEPWDHGALFGEAVQTATIGGVVAAGVAGSRRVSAGGARDHLLGFTAVSGRAEIFKAGGKVVKNVTGFDLAKVIAGSWGQLAVMTELAIKVVPKPKAVATIAVHGLAPQMAVSEMAKAMGSVASPVAAAHVPAANGQPACTLLRLEGFAPSVDFRAGQLVSLLCLPGAERMDDAAADAAWRQVREARSLGNAEALWRIQIAPSRASGLAGALSQAGAEWFMDWAGALLWAGAPAALDLHAIITSHVGHTMLMRGPDELMRAVPLRHSQQAAVAALSERVKRAFDPAGILDPDRFG